LDDHTLECSVRSERVNGSARVVRPLYSRRARGCTSGRAAKYISFCVTVSIACRGRTELDRVGAAVRLSAVAARGARRAAGGRPRTCCAFGTHVK
jgi:hypothetical protein